MNAVKNKSTQIKIMLIDDHQIITDGIKMLLSENPNLQVVAESHSGEDALLKVGQAKPDIIVCDLSLPGMDGFTLIEKISEQCPGTAFLILSRHTEAAYIKRALEIGVQGYLPKSIAQEELLDAVQALAEGKNYYNSEVSKVMMDTMAKTSKRVVVPGTNQSLTSREADIVRHIVEGFSSQEISKKLSISARTVENHRANILQKFGIKNTAQLVKYAIQHKLVDF